MKEAAKRYRADDSGASTPAREKELVLQEATALIEAEKLEKKKREEAEAREKLD